MSNATNNNAVKSINWVPEFKDSTHVTWTFENVSITAFVGKSPTYELITWNEATNEWDAQEVSYEVAADRYQDTDELPTVKQLLAWMKG